MNIQHAVDEFLSYIKIEKNLSNNTFISYEYDLHCFTQFLIKQNRSLILSDISLSTVRRFIQDQVVHSNIKPRTLQRRISCLKSFSKFCVKDQFLDLDFMAGVDSPKSDMKLPNYMKLSELHLFFTYLEQDSHPFSLRNEVMFKLLATTGMRKSELVCLTWK
ncbi:site-specific integrase [Bacillus sp. JJ664]